MKSVLHLILSLVAFSQCAIANASAYEITKIQDFTLRGGSQNFIDSSIAARGFWIALLDGKIQYYATSDNDDKFRLVKAYDLNDADPTTPIILSAPAVPDLNKSHKPFAVVGTCTKKVFAIAPERSNELNYLLVEAESNFSMTPVFEDDGTAVLIRQDGSGIRVATAPDNPVIALISQHKSSHKLPEHYKQKYKKIDYATPFNAIRLPDGKIFFVLREFRFDKNGDETESDSLCFESADSKTVFERTISSPLCAKAQLVQSPNSGLQKLVYATKDSRLHICDSSGVDNAGSPLVLPALAATSPLMLQNGQCAIAGTDQVLRIVDIDSGTLKYSWLMPSRASSSMTTLTFKNGEQIIVVSCSNGIIYYLSETAKLVAQYALRSVNHGTPLDLGSGVHLIPTPDVLVLRLDKKSD